MASLVESYYHYYNQVDEVISEKVYDVLDYIGAGSLETSSLTKDLYFVHSPTPLVLLLLSYFIILGIFYPYIKSRQKIDPQACKNDNTFIRGFALFHNLFLTILSLWMGVMVAYYAYTTGYKFWGTGFDESRDTKICYVIYVFYLSKFYEFFDTYIMLLKGNLSQISFLHVYHHASTCIIFWMVSKHAPGGDTWWCITVNSFVHVIMYTYYFLTTIIKDKATRRRYLWWGIYLTQIQMSQFLVNIIQAIYGFAYSEYWYFGKILQSFDMTVLLAFFLNFYIKKYILPNNTDENTTKIGTKVKTQ